MKISTEDEKIDASLHQAIDNYRRKIGEISKPESRPEALHRLADLQIQSIYQSDISLTHVKSGASAAIEHYRQILEQYPKYENIDRVLYQLARAYQEIGDSRNATDTLLRLSRSHPDFALMDEVKFRLGENYYTERKYLLSRNAYKDVITYGEKSKFYGSALIKLGWSSFKLEDYHESLASFIKALNHEAKPYQSSASATGTPGHLNLDEIHRAISLCFANMGGAEAIDRYIDDHSDSAYIETFYQNLAEYYISKDRFTDAADTYRSYMSNHPDSKSNPYNAIRIIDTYLLGGFTQLASDARKSFLDDYGPDAEYWDSVDHGRDKQITELIKDNIIAHASNFHADYQKQKGVTHKQHSYDAAVRWYRKFYYLYPLDSRAPSMSKQLATLHLENGEFLQSAREFERIAKNYPESDIAADSAYAALYAYREYLATLPRARHMQLRESIANKSLWFADRFSHHPEVANVLTSAAYDYLLLKNLSAAVSTAERVIQYHAEPGSPQSIRAQVVLADAAFESGNYADAEQAYRHILELTGHDDKRRPALLDNLSASIYKQAINAKTSGDHDMAARHFLRLKAITPDSELSTSAQYEAASELITIGELSEAALVLEDFQRHNPAHELSATTSKNLVAIYRKNNELHKAARELEHIYHSTDDPEVRRAALLEAARLYHQAMYADDALRVFEQYIATFPDPLTDIIESYYTSAFIYKSKGDIARFTQQLHKVISTDAMAGDDRTDRTRYLAALSLRTLAKRSVDDFMAVELTMPFERNLQMKRKKMEIAIEQLSRLLGYQISETTTAATYLIAEIYLNFSQSLADSDRPTELNPLELEQYELALDEQVYQFEEKAIEVYRKNTELLYEGVHDEWIDKSLARLSSLFPAQYAKPEQQSEFLMQLYAGDNST